MKPTVFVYSSHNRCEYIHRDWIVERALESWDNKTIFYLPMSSVSLDDQEYSWGTFSWFFDRFRQYGLEPRTFLYRDDLRREDAQVFFDWLSHSEVVILGGGRPALGRERYRTMGGRFFGNPEAFVETLRARQAQGKLTVGFSAGADQLCQHSSDGSGDAFGLIQNVLVTLHFEPARAGQVQHLAREHPDCLVFGLPNDAGIAVSRGRTLWGNFWQLIQFVTDLSWDVPEDHFHIKTRQGVKIEHCYADGRDWKFGGGDVLLRILHQDGGRECWIKRPELPSFIDYFTQAQTHHRCTEEILHGR